MVDSARSRQPPVMRTSLAVLGAVIAATFATSVQADALRCGNKLVRDGDTRAAVRNHCGEPSDVQTRSILRRPHYSINGRLVYDGDAFVEIPVEVWTYNFGPY